MNQTTQPVRRTIEDSEEQDEALYSNDEDSGSNRSSERINEIGT